MKVNDLHSVFTSRLKRYVRRHNQYETATRCWFGTADDIEVRYMFFCVLSLVHGSELTDSLVIC